MRRRYKFLIGMLIFCLFYYIVYSTDSDKPDTFANKNYFEDLLDMDLPEDVTELYCYSDYVGLDGASQMMFHCSKSTVYAIAKHRALLKSDGVDNAPFHIWRRLPNWNIECIQTIVPYVKKNEAMRHYCYLWYNEKTQTAYYIYFDM